jgi:predicted DNA-binding transcriptional regulator AlpA
MMSHTIEIIRTALKADPSVAANERARLLATMRGDGEQALKHARVVEQRLIRRAEVARRLGCSLRLVDRLAKDGALVKRKLPGRKRAAGILESDLLALIAEDATLESAV